MHGKVEISKQETKLLMAAASLGQPMAHKVIGVGLLFIRVIETSLAAGAGRRKVLAQWGERSFLRGPLVRDRPFE